ncbi:MAG: hypothetical protein WB788_06495 [Thermoplasmata archaeon]|nr:hypothetical protein [Thermoplasmata archaeon]
MEARATVSPLALRIDAALNQDLDRPWCVHRLYEELPLPPVPESREDKLIITQRAADELVTVGRAQREYVSATAIGVHCEDVLYWSTKARRVHLADFGPEFESPTVLQRLASHFQCRGL